MSIPRNNANSNKIVVGIDASKDTLEISINGGKTYTIKNAKSAVKRQDARLMKTPFRNLAAAAPSVLPKNVRCGDFRDYGEREMVDFEHRYSRVSGNLEADPKPSAPLPRHTPAPLLVIPAPLSSSFPRPSSRHSRVSGNPEAPPKPSAV